MARWQSAAPLRDRKAWSLVAARQNCAPHSTSSSASAGSARGASERVGAGNEDGGDTPGRVGSKVLSYDSARGNSLQRSMIYWR
jgi:hypothetical protein